MPVNRKEPFKQEGELTENDVNDLLRMGAIEDLKAKQRHNDAALSINNTFKPSAANITNMPSSYRFENGELDPNIHNPDLYPTRKLYNAGVDNIYHKILESPNREPDFGHVAIPYSPTVSPENVKNFLEWGKSGGSGYSENASDNPEERHSNLIDNIKTQERNENKGIGMQDAAEYLKQAILKKRAQAQQDMINNRGPASETQQMNDERYEDTQKPIIMPTEEEYKKLPESNIQQPAPSIYPYSKDKGIDLTQNDVVPPREFKGNIIPPVTPTPLEDQIQQDQIGPKRLMEKNDLVGSNDALKNALIRRLLEKRV